MATGQLSPTNPVRTHEKAVPHSMGFFNPKVVDPKIKAVKDRFRVDSDVQSYTSDQNTRVVFTLKNDSVLDFSRARLVMDVVVDQPTAPAGATCCISNPGVFTLFKNIRIRAPGIKEELQEYHRWAGILRETFSEPGVAPLVASEWGFGSLLQRQAWATAGKRTYQMPIDFGMLARGPLPLHLIRDQIKLEFELAPLAESCEASAGATGMTRVTLSNVYLMVDQYFCPYYEQVLSRMVLGNGLNIGTINYEWFLTPVKAGSLNQNLNITNRSDSVENMLVIFQPANYTASVYNPDKFILWQAVVAQWQLFRKGRLWPSQPFQSLLFYEEFHRMLKDTSITGIWRPRSTISLGRYNVDRNLLTIEINPFEGDGLLSNDGNSSYTADTQLRLTFSAVPAADLDAHVFVRRYASIFLTADGHLSAPSV